MLRGLFITFEGLDGSGKTTQMRRLAAWLTASGRNVVMLRQPGSTALGDRLRAVLLDSRSESALGPISPLSEMALMFADRAQAIAQGDLTNPDDCLRMLQGIEIVVNASGAVSAAGVDQVRHMEIIARNLITSVRLIQAAWVAGVERFLVLSSHTTYPAADYPIKEEEAWSGPPHPAYFSYSWMRRYVEKLGEFVHEKSKTKIALVRPTAVFGEYDNFEPASCHVVPALIVKAVSRMDPYQVWGTGTRCGISRTSAIWCAAPCWCWNTTRFATRSTLATEKR